MAPRVFLITGTSTGFGQEYVKEILAKGDYAVATARKSSSLSFQDGNDTNLLLVDLDVTSKESIDKAFDAALKKFGRIDVGKSSSCYKTTTPRMLTTLDGQCATMQGMGWPVSLRV